MSVRLGIVSSVCMDLNNICRMDECEGLAENMLFFPFGVV